MKKCNVCKETKSEDSFGTNGISKNGKRYLKSKCRDCDNKRKRELNKEKPELSKAVNKRFYEKNAQKMRDKAKKWREENPEKSKQQCREWYKKNKDRAKCYNLNYKYGISLNDYKKMQKEQNNKCYICKIKDDNLVVDHNHKTGEVRKLLCVSCNIFIGKMEKDTDRLMAALNYLEIPRA